MWLRRAVTFCVATAAVPFSPVVVVEAWTVRSTPESLPPAHVQGAAVVTRRQLAKAAAAAAAAALAATAAASSRPLPAGAYDRRDVGGTDRSPETAAMNEVAYRTNNRLEKAGFALETAAEQSASLTSALAGVSYDASAKKTTTTPARSSPSRPTSSAKSPRKASN
jgi:hypothetical protein